MPAPAALAGNTLRNSEAEYYSAVDKNLQIEVACAALERELGALRAAVAAAAGAGAAEGQLSAMEVEPA